MKVKELIEALAKADPEMTVCQFTEGGAEELEDLGVFKGNYLADISPKMIWSHASGEYVGLGNPGDYEETAPVEDCEPIRDLRDADNGSD
jgi:hypothetical protein